jgi:hypothetical protein
MTLIHSSDYKLVKCCDRKDGYKWLCHKKIGKKDHYREASIRKDSWFEKSIMSMEEVLKFTHWWSVNLPQHQIIQQLSLATNTAVDWDSFCREVCEVTIMRESCKIGGEGKVVQIDESLFGKRKYHRGHVVKGQWVFGGIESDSRLYDCRGL